MQPRRLSCGISHPTCIPACAPFTPSNSGQRSPPTYYRGCWHVVSRGFLTGYRHYRPLNRALQPEGRLHSRGVAASGFPPLCNIPPLLPPVGVWAVSQSQCGRSTSQSGYRSSAWWPLPHQLPNRARAHLKADCSFDTQMMPPGYVMRY